MTRTPVTSKDDLEKEDSQKALISPRELVELRRIDVVRRRLQGQSVSVIASELGESTSVIYNDIKSIRESNEKYTQDFNQDEFIGESLNIFKKIEEESWEQVFILDKGDARKAKFLDSVRSSRKEQIKLLQNSGMLHKEAEKLEVHLSTDIIGDWSDHQKHLVADAIVEAAILDDPPKALGPAVDAELEEEDE